MMERLKPILLLALLCSYFSFAFTCLAEPQEIQQQIVEINALADKEAANKQLTQLLESRQLANSQRIEVLMQQGKNLLALSEFKQAISYIEEALDIAKQQDLLPQQALANKLLGVLHYYLAEYAKALSYYQEALVYYDDLSGQLIESKVKDNAISRANLLNNIALVYTSTADTALALQSYKLAEPLYQAFGDEIDKIDIRYNIAVLHINLRRFDIAISMLKDVIVKRDQLSDPNGVAKARADLGVAYKYSAQYELAKQHLLVALSYFIETDNKFEIASQWHNLSEIYNDLQDHETSEEYAQKAIALSKEIGHQKAYVGSLQSLAKVLFYQGKLDQALENITLSSQVAEKINYQGVVVDNLAQSALILAAKGEYSQALSRLKAYEAQRHQSANTMLNEHLARFEAEQLSQQVIRLKQNEKLRLLQAEKAQQQRNFVLLAFIFFLIVTFLIYRRYLEGRLTNELEKRVKQRTQELELLTKELQQANQIKSQFLANMSHEIRTPLTSIVGQSEAIIAGDISSEDIPPEVEIIHGNSLHLMHLINEILDLSKIEANKLDLELRQHNLLDIINDLDAIFSEQAKKKGLNFTIKQTLPSPFIVNIDALRVKQILINLCSNAIKFTEKGQVSLDISSSQEKLVFAVADTGVGMSSQQLSHIFELFSQGDNTISRRFGGSGLGLYLSKQLALLMSGEIEVESQQEKGSTFKFSMPFKRLNFVEQTSLLQINDKQSEFAKTGCYQGQILLADDHHDNRRLIARLLESTGLEVISAVNGVEVIELCKKHHPRMILLDIQMPEMDGIETFRRLRAQGFKQPIYALTANAMSHEISAYLALGFDGHLKKPIERQAFIATIDKYYGESAGNSNNESTLNKVQADLAAVDISDLKKDFCHSLVLDKENLLLLIEKKDYQELTRLAHRIAGAGKMFGFNEVGQLAKELEAEVNKYREQSFDNDEAYLELVHCLIEEINLILP